MKLNTTAATSGFGGAFAATVLLMLSSASPLPAITYQLSGSVGPCPFNCVASTSETVEAMPVLGNFSFRFEVGGATGVAAAYTGGPDFTTGFSEYLSASWQFLMEETDPAPGVGLPGYFPFPGFSSYQAVDRVFWYPAGTVGHNGDSELQLRMLFGSTDWEADLRLYFAPGFTGTGSIDPAFRDSALRIWNGGCCQEGFYNITSASVAPVGASSAVPEPQTGLLALVPLLWIIASRRRKCHRGSTTNTLD
jgi:hypothetical protein